MRNVVADAIAEVEAELSVFLTNSVVSRLNRGETIEVPERCHAAAVIRFALETAEASGGAFDPTVGPLLHTWGFRGGGGAFPSFSVISNALASVGWWRVCLKPAGQGRVRISAGGAEIDLGGIAKGYAVDLAVDRLVEAGRTDFIVNLGGNIRVYGVPATGRADWNIAVRDPSGRHSPIPLPRRLRSGEAVATSGSYERFVEIGGRRYSHIIDPRTGLPVDNGLGSVSVIAPSAMAADACSTTLFVLGREAGAAFLAARPGCTAVFIDQ
jgi:thiamine biosynthesis lipoprotein